MRLRALLFTVAALAGAGLAAHRIGAEAAQHVERSTAARVADALADGGEDWAGVETDGLIVSLVGAAPDEARRLRAAEMLRRIVHPSRIRDATTLAAADPLAPPPFALELLRDDTAVSLIGLAPETAGHAAIAEALAAAGLDGAVSDMLESVASPAPEGWEAALGFGLAALAESPQAKVSVAPGRVAVAILAASEADRMAIEAALRRDRPDGVALELAITAPLPVIAPFQIDFALEGGTGRLGACAAETEADAAAIAGAAGRPPSDCALGLGAPSSDWAAAATAGIAAVRGLGGGRFSLVDAAAALAVPGGAPPEQVEATTEALQAALPEMFSLEVEAPAPEPVVAGAPPAPPRFDAALGEDGRVRLSGPVADATSRAAIESYATALFGWDRVENVTEVSAGLPEGWPGRVLAGVEALALMKEGRIEVTPGGVALEGWAKDADGAAKAAALFATRDFGETDLAVRFDAAAAAAEAEARAALEDPAGTCARAVDEIVARAAIAFEPGSATLDESAGPTIAALAAAFADCPPVDFEIAGHTDSQGDPERNQALSEERAATVKAALEAAADLPQVVFVARGYGADRPIADNDTEDGRAQNRRIAFTLVETDAAAAAPPSEVAFGPR